MRRDVTHLRIHQPGATINVRGGGGTYGGGGTHSATAVGGGGGGAHEATAVSGGGNSGGGGGGGDAALVLLVVAAAALPIVVYAIDEDAQPDVMQCWATPEERVSLLRRRHFGVLWSGPVPGHAGPAAVARAGHRGRFRGYEHGSFDSTGRSWRASRPSSTSSSRSPSAGRRIDSSTLGSQSWFEVALPQRYTPFRWNALEPGVSFDLHPAFLWNPSGVWDVRLDAAVVFPLGPYASIDVGGRAYSFQSRVQGGAILGLQLSL